MKPLLIVCLLQTLVIVYLLGRSSGRPEGVAIKPAAPQSTLTEYRFLNALTAPAVPLSHADTGIRKVVFAKVLIPRSLCAIALHSRGLPWHLTLPPVRTCGVSLITSDGLS
jgi:hypothetical protein